MHEDDLDNICGLENNFDKIPKFRIEVLNILVLLLKSFFPEMTVILNMAMKYLNSKISHS